MEPVSEKIISHIDDVIDRDLERHLGRLRELVRQPSISYTGEGIAECAELVAGYFNDLGCDPVKIYETPGHPVVYGERWVGAPKTLLVYFMYDVMPVKDDPWTVDPFEGLITSEPPYPKVLMGRGATNSKGPMGAFLNAVEAIQDAGETLPVNLIFIAEGEEEMGSKSLYGFVKEHADMLKRADAVFMPMGKQERDGGTLIWPGTKGIVYLTLECDGKTLGRGPRDYNIHSSLKAIADNPAWVMIQALASMTTPDGNRALIKGFYDDVKPPSDKQKELFKAVVDEVSLDAFRNSLHVDNFIGNESKIELMNRFFFQPTLNIDGISAGYTGEGSKTILPYKAIAKIDMRIVPDMDPDDIVSKVRKHLDDHGFEGIQMQANNLNPPCDTDPDAEIIQAAVRALRPFGVNAKVWPRNMGFIPFPIFSGPPLNLEFCVAGLGHGERAHGPDEFFVIEGDGKVKGLREIEKSFVRVLYEYASTVKRI
ncbi:MAG: M20/M25/M40 family metallo-hydrolase [Desulfobacteraceae bacterium]|nr:M20/M25/M40 family metallo-hydrolase [Desulfobacteraceae bacterium]